eukprot:CAMPEP_0170525624 /NCGR_PEP_ID=MMETSP0209-20121228/11063_1 /TAXON_ID=665100 ORGANISM="Litonotus pictus, Strain P1" /NCGR_SAMPLE_ID=MMETSP0209 /ASSEMBLY_ACC=CAM_ASM_000301 /LENGTH=100 /DNA_ID=CAMNT_0010814959 /DNA_START=135 /DNA_END=437 /DNA_ORIENTATION=-
MTDELVQMKAKIDNAEKIANQAQGSASMAIQQANDSLDKANHAETTSANSLNVANNSMTGTQQCLNRQCQLNAKWPSRCESIACPSGFNIRGQVQGGSVS